MLVVSGLVAGYGTKRIATLDDVTLRAGESALLLGPSGAGKTTILLTLAGLLPRLAGDVRIDGTDPQAGNARTRDRFRGTSIGFVFQELNLVAGLTALENVLLAPFACGLPQDSARATSLLKQLNLADHIDAPAAKLSRGQAQRVALARALMLSPKLLIVDEPTASLDDDATQIVGTLLVDAAEQHGATLLVATHDGRLKSRIARHINVRAPT
jgi:putative ABC transport system ATP-binding protein